MTDNYLKPLQIDEEFQALIQKDSHTELELGDIHDHCLKAISHSRRNIVLEMVRTGWHYRIIQHLQTWQQDGSEAPNFDVWLHDPDHTCGMSHKWAWDCIRISEMSERLLNDYNINLLDFLDIGWRKLILVDRAIKKFGADRESILDWLHKGMELSATDLEQEVTTNPYIRGFGRLRGKTLAIEYSGDDLDKLDDKQVCFSLREKKSK